MAGMQPGRQVGRRDGKQKENRREPNRVVVIFLNPIDIDGDDDNDGVPIRRRKCSDITYISPLSSILHFLLVR